MSVPRQRTLNDEFQASAALFADAVKDLYRMTELLKDTYLVRGRHAIPFQQNNVLTVAAPITATVSPGALYTNTTTLLDRLMINAPATTVVSLTIGKQGPMTLVADARNLIEFSTPGIYLLQAGEQIVASVATNILYLNIYGMLTDVADVPTGNW